MKVSPILSYLFIAVILGLTSGKLQSQEKIKLQLDRSPEEVGLALAENVVNRHFGWRYQKVCAYYGTLLFADITDNKQIVEKVEAGIQPYVTGKRKYRKGHVDFNVFGIWPFELYQQTGKKEYLVMALNLADHEFENPRPDGLTSLSRFWVDDMYMVGSLQVQAYKATKNPLYLDRAAFHLVKYIDSLQKPNGLFYHRADAHHYWGRGNGWGAAAMGELLTVLPEDHEHYSALVKAYKKMMDGIVKYQGESGMWHQLMDDHESFAESSCTGMFLFALITGIDQGILTGNKYLHAVEKAWNALTSEYINEKGEVLNTSMWTNAKKRVGYYHRRPRIPGDYHGQAAALWASTALLRLLD